VTYEVTSPRGPLPVASWSCRTCTAGSGELYRHTEAAADGSDVRDAAMAHLRAGGHPVTYRKGTVEDLEPMATEVPT
jgi:hypothetical protein